MPGGALSRGIFWSGHYWGGDPEGGFVRMGNCPSEGFQGENSSVGKS